MAILASETQRRQLNTFIGQTSDLSDLPYPMICNHGKSLQKPNKYGLFARRVAFNECLANDRADLAVRRIQMGVQIKTRNDSSCGRSRVTNGRSHLPKEVDGRSFYSRRLRDLIALHTADLGGADALSAAEAALVRRAAVIMIALEKMEMRFALAGSQETPASDLDLYQRLSNSLRRLFREVGIKRQPRDVTPSLQDYLRTKTIDHDDAPLRNGSLDKRVRQ